MRYCEKCGARVADDSMYCQNCGSKLRIISSNSNDSIPVSQSNTDDEDTGSAGMPQFDQSEQDIAEAYSEGSAPEKESSADPRCLTCISSAVNQEIPASVRSALRWDP